MSNIIVYTISYNQIIKNRTATFWFRPNTQYNTIIVAKTLQYNSFKLQTKQCGHYIMHGRIITKYVHIYIGREISIMAK